MSSRADIIKSAIEGFEGLGILLKLPADERLHCDWIELLCFRTVIMPMGVEPFAPLPNHEIGVAAGLVSLSSVPYCQSHHLIISRGLGNLAHFRFTL